MASLRSATKTTRIFGTFVLVAGTLAVLAPIARATPTPCKVVNLGTMQVYTGTGANLQAAIDAAAGGTTLRIRGLCVGNFTINKDLTLIGIPTAADPAATLGGSAAGTVLKMDAASVTLRNLTITNGSSVYGGGINNEQGTLTLMGSSSVAGNTADVGGGIFNLEGTVTLRGSSSVTGNTATAHGGGICNDAGTTTLRDLSTVAGNSAVYAGGGISTLNSGPIGGTLTLQGSSSVIGNTASGAGGIYVFSFQPARYARTRVIMKGSSSVTANMATDGPGGGIVNDKGVLTLKGSSSVTGNTSASVGGGIYNNHRVNACTTWTGAISPNDPDDPPPLTWITC